MAPIVSYYAGGAYQQFHCDTRGCTNLLSYDRRSKSSILKYARLLEGTNLRTILQGAAGLCGENSVSKGSFGQTLETQYFLYQNNNDSRPDFWEVGVELKTTPVIKRRDGRLRAKERLSITQINYVTVVEESFESSSLLKKMSSMLVVFYQYLPGISSLDFPIEKVVMWELPDSDYALIKADWETIVDKVRSGLAHELSGSDTLFLEAAPKAANSSVRRSQPYSSIPAKPRAFALKPTYVNSIFDAPSPEESLQLSDAELAAGFEAAVMMRLEPFIGMAEDALLRHFGMGATSAKGRYAELTARMLGVARGTRIAEFDKADIVVRTCRVTQKGTLKEAVSFPAFNYHDVAETSWDESDFRATLSKKFLFMLYQLPSDPADKPTFIGARFWAMPYADLESEARRCYEKSANMIREDRLDYLPASSTNRCCHVRPHGRNSEDVVMTPSGNYAIKRSFWLNQRYLSEQLMLSRASESR